MWPDLEVWELMPLSQGDMQRAAEARSMDVEAFRRLLESRDVGALASRPITLELLFNLFDQGKTLPSSRLEVYKHGLEVLCEEPDPRRPRAGESGTLPIQARFVLAGRLATLMLLCQRHSVWIGRIPALCPDGAIELIDLPGLTEQALEDEHTITLERVQEVLRSGLFSDRGAQLLGWAHRTFAEMLTAEYLVSTKLPASMLLGLMIHPGDDKQQVAPQFHGVAAWMVDVGAGDSEAVGRTRSSDLFGLLVERQPELLLASDLEQRTESDREQLVQNLLRRYEYQKIHREFMQGWLQETRLRHPALPDQLRPYITDKTRSFSARHAALMIARSCQLAILHEEFLRVALDDSDDIGLRTTAIHCLELLGNSRVRAQLHSLLDQSPEQDPSDELHGAALCCLWPEHLSPEELFKHIHPRRNPGLFGSYWSFLHHVMLQRLTDTLVATFLPPALRWGAGMAEVYSDPYHDTSTTELLVNFVGLAWPRLDDAAIFEEFVAFVDKWIKARYELPGLKFDTEVAPDAEETEIRRRLVTALLQRHDATSERAPSLAVCRNNLILRSDLPWLVEQLQTEKDEGTQKAIIDLLRFHLRHNDAEDLAWLESVLSLHPMLERHFSHWLKVTLDSTVAHRMKQEHRKTDRLLAEYRNQAEPSLLTPPPAERVAQRLARCKHDAQWYWMLERELTLEPTSKHYLRGDRYLDLTELPGWGEASIDTRARIVHAAHQFLHAFTPKLEDWTTPHQYSEALPAGLHAFHLLKRETPDEYKALSLETWLRWIPALVRVHVLGAWSWGIPLASSPSYPGIDLPLLTEAYSRLPDRVLEAFNALLTDSRFHDEHSLLTAKLKGIWDDHSAEMIRLLVVQERVPPNTWRALLGDLLEKHTPGVLEWALKLSSEPLPRDQEARQRRLEMALCLIVHATEAAWPTLWSLIQSEPRFGQTLLEKWLTAPRDQEIKVLYDLPLDQLEALLHWLIRHYAFRDMETGKVVRLLPSFQLEMLRDGLLGRLVDLGTPDAVCTLTRLEQSASDPQPLRWRVLEARKRMREKGLPSRDPKALLEFLKGDSLQRIAQKMLEAIPRPQPIPIFMSYAREDGELVLAIRSLLKQQYVAPFVDVVDLRGGELWEQALHERINQAQRILVFWSRWSQESEWVEEECRYALERMERDGLNPGFIMPVMLDLTKPGPSHPLARFNYLFFQAGELVWQESQVPPAELGT